MPLLPDDMPRQLLILAVLLVLTGAYVVTPKKSPGRQSPLHYSNNVESGTKFTHHDILWKIRPPPSATKIQYLKWKVTANLLRWDCLLRRQKAPTVLCPNNFGGQVVLEAHAKGCGKIGRFGITCQRGPSAPLIGTTVEQLYGIDPRLGLNLGIAAIVYLFVEPEYQGRDVGKLALQVIALIHGCAKADFTILVADDKSSGDERKLVKWFEEQAGYKQAPLLQEMMGSPNEQFGVSMIAPTDAAGVPDGCKIQWW